LSRVLVLGQGPLPHPAAPRLGFPELRSQVFAHGLAEAGFEVGLVCLLDAADAGLEQVPGGLPVAAAWSLVQERGDWIGQLRAIAQRWRPQAWVSAGPYNPARAAAACVGQEPLWIDVPGDPFAEAQARAAREGRQEPLDPAPLRAQLQAFAGALARGDVFSAASGPQRCALLGQLGLAGRLSRAAPEREWVHVIPPAFAFDDLPMGAPRRRSPGSPLVMALVGGCNAWLDEGGLWRAFTLAIEQGADLQLVCTGGAIRGHFDQGYAQLRALVERSPHRRRVRFLGWLPHAELPAALAEAHMLLNVDAAGYEAALGSRTRVLFALHQGLQVASTTGSDLCATLARLELILPLPSRAPQALAGALLEAAARGSDGQQVAAAQQHLATSHHPRKLLAPLLRWARAPDRAPAGEGALQALSQENLALRQQLAAIHGSPTWRILGGLHQRLKRLGGKASKQGKKG